MKKEIALNELFVCNLVGVVFSITVGCILGHGWILAGLLGTYFVPIPILYGYIYLRKLFGAEISDIKVQFKPGITWAGKKYTL